MKTSGRWSVQNAYSIATSSNCASGCRAATIAAPGRIATGRRGSTNSPCGVIISTVRGAAANRSPTYRTNGRNPVAASGSTPNTPSLLKKRNLASCVASIGLIDGRSLNQRSCARNPTSGSHHDWWLQSTTIGPSCAAAASNIARVPAARRTAWKRFAKCPRSHRENPLRNHARSSPGTSSLTPSATRPLRRRGPSGAATRCRRRSPARRDSCVPRPGPRTPHRPP